MICWHAEEAHCWHADGAATVVAFGRAVAAATVVAFGLVVVFGLAVAAATVVGLVLATAGPFGRVAALGLLLLDQDPGRLLVGITGKRKEACHIQFLGRPEV